MILNVSCLNPPQLWLAAAATRAGNLPEDQDDELHSLKRQLRVLIVEDEFFISLHNKELVETLGHVVSGVAVSADEAIKIAGTERPDVVLMDIRLVGPRDGIEAAAEIRKRFGIGSIFVTANTDAQTLNKAQTAEPLGFLEKPLTEERLRIGLAKVASGH